MSEGEACDKEAQYRWNTVDWEIFAIAKSANQIVAPQNSTQEVQQFAKVLQQGKVVQQTTIE